MSKTRLRRRIDADPALSSIVSEAAKRGELDGLVLVIDGRALEISRRPPQNGYSRWHHTQRDP